MRTLKPRLIVIVKEPRPGRVKTQLGSDIGMVHAAWWYRHNVARLLRRLHSPKWDLVLAVSPDREGLASRVWPSHVSRVAQGPGDLGARMARLLNTFAPAPTCIVGSDIPQVEASHVRACFAALGSHSGVLAPSNDGGYWLVGLRNHRPAPPSFMRHVRWSTQDALADTQASAPGISWALGPTLRDVDTKADLDAVKAAM